MSPDGSIWTVGYVGDMLRSTTPSVFSVSPDMGSNDGPATVNLSGSGFWAGMKVSLARGSTVVNGTGVNVTSPYEATCSFNLNGAPAGNYDVVTVNANGLTSTLPGGFSVTSPNLWYLPEGSTAISQAGQFETWVLVENPGDKPARVDVDYMTPGGQIAGPRFTMAPASRQSVNVSDTVPNEASVSTKVASDKPIAASRSMYWDTPQKNRQAAHGSIGVNFLSNLWYLHEGSTGSDARGTFETWVLVQNPGKTAANVKLTYLTPSGKVAGPSVSLAAGSRQTFNVADTVPGQWNVSTRVEADGPVVAERVTYWDAADFRQADHGSVGCLATSDTWLVPEGSTGSNASGGFDTWILVQNPGGSAASVSLKYMTPAGEVAGPSFKLAANSRRSISVADTVGNNWSVSTTVSSDKPVVVDGTLYWNAAGQFRRSALSSRGFAP